MNSVSQQAHVNGASGRLQLPECHVNGTHKNSKQFETV